VTPARTLDVRAVSCPLTWVKTKVALDRLEVGELLEVLLGAGEPVESVPRTAAEDGHRLVALGPLPGAPAPAFRLLLQKGTPPAALPEIP
jgi:TusA-related sulfurtransferase